MKQGLSISEFVHKKNEQKLIFTPGPASLLEENIAGLGPCFGRGDQDYEKIELEVLNRLKLMTGHENIVRLQGSASLAIEVMISNFIFGKVLIIQTGYYSERLELLVKNLLKMGEEIKILKSVPYEDIDKVNERFDWILACYTETSFAIKIPMARLQNLKTKTGAKLMLDATGSIGLENDHELSEVIAYSSCKGLFGFTGGAFIAHNVKPTIEPFSFALKLATYRDKLTTGPYHSILSLSRVLEKHEEFLYSVLENKKRFAQKMRNYLVHPKELEPLLCTHVKCNIDTNNSRVILYKPRIKISGSIICHLGEAHLKTLACGDILSSLFVK
jgi:2-aminoethylphosphonate-pyruvate transaminase